MSAWPPASPAAAQLANRDDRPQASPRLRSMAKRAGLGGRERFGSWSAMAQTASAAARRPFEHSFHRLEAGAEGLLPPRQAFAGAHALLVHVAGERVRLDVRIRP